MDFMPCAKCGRMLLMGTDDHYMIERAIVCTYCWSKFLKENKMKDEIAEVKISDLKKAYDEGCDDVKEVLRNMYPEIFKEKKEYCCDWMRYAIDELSLIKNEDCYRFEQRAGKNRYIGLDVLNYCPKCGTRL